MSIMTGNKFFERLSKQEKDDYFEEIRQEREEIVGDLIDNIEDECASLIEDCSHDNVVVRVTVIRRLLDLIVLECQ